MKKVKTVNYQGITGRGETVDLTYDVWDGSHLTDADDVIFNGAGVPSPADQPSGRGNMGSVAGDSDQFTPSGVPTATAPTGETPTE